MTGTIARIVSDRGFGFVRDDATGKEYFFHKTAVSPSRHEFDRMKAGQAVEYEIDNSNERPRCESVELLHRN